MNLAQLFQRVLDVRYVELPENSASYRVSVECGTLFIFFEETNGNEDWKNNFDFFVKPYKDMEYTWRVHRGFLRVWKTIEPHIVDDIMSSKIKKIVIAGYSHGAAIATLCHEYCRFHRPDIQVQGFGFGCPRVIWGHIPQSVKSRFEGFVWIKNGPDIVTHLPPVLFGFRHVGKKLQVGAGQKYGLIRAHYPECYHKELMKSEEAKKYTIW